MKKVLVAVFFGFLLSSCSYYDYTAESTIDKYTDSIELAKINSSRLELLEPGMSKSQVLETMGTQNAHYINNPYLVSLFSIEEDHITIIYYYTDYTSSQQTSSAWWRDSWKVSAENTTALVLLNGKLIGWGEEALRRVQDKYDFTIKKDFNIKVD